MQLVKLQASEEMSDVGNESPRNLVVGARVRYVGNSTRTLGGNENSAGAQRTTHTLGGDFIQFFTLSCDW